MKHGNLISRHDRRLKRSAVVGLLAGSVVLLCAMTILPCRGLAWPQGKGSPSALLNVVTGQPGSVVFVNEVRHGSTDETGALELRIKPGSYSVRIRTVGFSDRRLPVVLAASARRTLKISQQPTTDQATIHLQRGDYLRDKAKHRDAIKEYEEALSLRSVFPEARVAFARSLIPLQQFQEAETQLQTAIKEHRSPFPEAHTVLANLRRQQGLLDEAVGEYRKALRFAKGVSPEAHIGLAIALNELGETEASIKEYRIGITQDMDTEPILYYQLGSILEKNERNAEAIKAYESYLRLDPKGELSSAVESIIEQLKKDQEQR